MKSGTEQEKDSSQSTFSALVEEIGRVQRTSFARRKLWHDYCDEHFAGTRDPSWRNSAELRAFLDLLAATPVMTTKAANAHAELVEEVKMIQRTTVQGRDQWRSFYESNSGGNRPLANLALHSPASLRLFLDGLWREVRRPAYKGKHSKL
jgi:hypothetical protein